MKFVPKIAVCSAVTALLNEDEYSVPSPVERGITEDRHAILNETDRRNLKSMIDDACLSVKPTFKFQMPWERKGLAKIFNRDPAKLIPEPVMTPIEFSEQSSQSSSPQLPTILGGPSEEYTAKLSTLIQPLLNRKWRKLR